MNDDMVHGHLTRPLPLTCTPDFPIIQYADDTLVILLVDVNQLLHLESLIINFGAATRLKVNYGKSSLIPINVGEEFLQLLLDTLNCQQRGLPFTYLGLPLSTTKLRKEFFMPLLLSSQRRLSSCSIYLNYGYMLRIINFVLSLIAHLLFEHFESLCLGPQRV
jgi:hypothetical protein